MKRILSTQRKHEQPDFNEREYKKRKEKAQRQKRRDKHNRRHEMMNDHFSSF